MPLIDIAESGRLPDAVIRLGIRHLLRRRLKAVACQDPEQRTAQDQALIQVLRGGPVAVDTRAANVQHYEVPAEFFRRVLGPRLKYSCCLYERGQETLAQAEEAMLALTCARAAIENGMRILELGCGWGALTLWMADHYPDCHITAVSNSNSQREYIESRCRQAGHSRVTVITRDMRDFHTDERHDRVISVEMFEHMRNYSMLMQRISRWLLPDGKLFVHIFSHREASYLFESQGEANWMGRHFFTGGIMPSDTLLLHFQDHLSVEQHWRISGRHYARTCEDWLRRQDEDREQMLALFASGTDAQRARVLHQRWRMFFMACAELFRYRGGTEWFVSHYLFRNRPAGPGEKSHRSPPDGV